MPEQNYDRDALVQVLRFHQKSDGSGCACGWHAPSSAVSHPHHVADVYEEVLLNG